MPVLSRLRLGSIGVAAARFDPLDLELVGPDLRLRHTLLSLRNGGGKSSLIGLVLVLLNPKVAASLGRTSRGDRKLESDYVRRDETGIVLAEWLPDQPGAGAPRRHVTFMAMKRGEREGATDKGFVGATLPFDVDPVQAFELFQLVPLADRAAEQRAHAVEALLRRAREVQRAHPDWEVVAIPGHEPGRWLEHLRAIGLDPGLATLLARMNLEEGDLAKALTFSSPDEFVAQAARLLAPPDDVLRNLHLAVGAWAGEHRDQADKRRARDELARVRPRWTALVEQGAAHHTARDRLKEEAFDALALLEGVEAAQPDVRARVDAAEQALREAEAERRDAIEAIARLEGEVAAVDDALARARLERAATDAAEAAAAVTRTEGEERLARALLPALRLTDTEARLAALQAQRAARRTETAPQAQRRDALALGLAAHARDEAARSQSERDDARAHRAQATREARAAQEARAAHDKAAARLTAEHAELTRRLEAAREAIEGLLRDGLVTRDEPLSAAVARAEARVREADDLLTQQRETLREAEHAATRATSEAQAHARQVKALGTQRQSLERELHAATQACATLTSRVVAAQVPDLSAPQLPDDGEHVLDALRRAHRDAIVRHATSASRLAALEATCESLRARDLLPAPTDVQAVCDATTLTPALDWLRTTLGDAAGEALRSVPGLAHGAVAPSAAALGRARERLEQLELTVDAPVPVYLAGDLTPDALARAAGSGVAPRQVVGLAPHASADARAALLERRTAEREHVRRLVSELTERCGALDGLVQDAADVLGRQGLDAQRTLTDRLTSLDVELRATAEAQARAQVAATDATALAATARAQVDASTSASRALQASERRLRVAQETHGECLEHGPARLAELDARRADAEAQAVAAQQTWSDATTRADDARDRADAAERARAAASERAQRLTELVEDRTTPPARIDDPLRATAELDALHRQLVAGEQAVEQAVLDLRTQAERLRKDLRAAAGDEATALAARAAITPGLTEAHALERARDAASAARAAAAADGAAKARRATARSEVTRTRAALAALSGLAAATAQAWTGPTDAGSLAPLMAALPARRDEANARSTRAAASVTDAARARDGAVALSKTWSRIVDDSREAWETVRACAPDLEPAIRAVVREGRNAQVILDPAGQAPRLGEAAARHRRELVARKGTVERAETSWLRAAHAAIIEAERSPSEVVRRFATVRLPARSVTSPPSDAGVHLPARSETSPPSDTRVHLPARSETSPPSDTDLEAERVRAVALRAALDLTQLDREVEDLDAQLADVARTRATLAQQLGEQVQRLAGRVRDLQRESVLPDGLGAWSGQEFLRIELPVLTEPAELHARLEVHLASWADRDAVPATRELLPDALAASLSGPPHVLMPKADRFDRPLRRRPISQLAKDSGGEALTAAFILFCVLSRVVSGGSRRGRRVSLALIDNPLGTANRFDFVEAQCAVAAAFGVQYVAATGITDPAAIERFERLITLTNPGQDRVSAEHHQDRGPGQPINAVLWARDAVLTASDGVPRRWPGQAT